MILRMPPIGFILPLVSAAVTGVVLVPEARSLAPSPTVAVSAKDASANALSLPTFSDAAIALAAFSDNPLLAENRQNPERPPAEPIEVREVMEEPTQVEIQTEALPVPPMVKMTGRMQINGQIRALLQKIEDGSEVWASPGDSIGAWTLVEITQDGAELLMEDDVITIKLFEE